MTNSVLKITIANFCYFIVLQTYPGHGRCVASWNFNCAWYVGPTFHESNSKVLLKLYDAFNFSLKLLYVFSRQLA